MAKYPGGVTVSGYIAPSDTLDTYATHKAQFGHGGYRSVADITARDAITDIRREIGMVVYVISEDKEYRLVGGILNTNWVEIVTPIGNGTAVDNNYIIVGSLAEMENYPAADRKIGQVFYASDVDREFRLVHGITNTHLVEQNLPVSTTSTINNYYNTFGCLNKPLILDAIMNAADSFKPIYKTPNGEEVISANDANIFSFIINKSDYWADDWIYFKGTSNIDSTKTNEVYIEITKSGATSLINVNLALAGTTYPNFEIHGTLSSWYGYFKNPNPGRVDLKVYEIQDGVTSFNINKSVYLFAPNFAIKDGTSLIPLDIKASTTTKVNKEYTFDVINNTSLVVVLARVNVTKHGIDTTNYSAVTSTMSSITANGIFTVNASIINTLIDGTYSLVVTGTDGGVIIPPYFYGPFVVSNT